MVLVFVAACNSITIPVGDQRESLTKNEFLVPTSVIIKRITAKKRVPNFYGFQYSVNDPYTGDTKSQYEFQDGSVIYGSYALNDADGTKRIVDYVADKNGFNAVIRKEPVQEISFASILFQPPTFKKNNF